ncbi:MBOAT family O-acyltransferase [Nodularia spumigena]|uniref:MBOAT family O-acyltransferase n=1 Tax=Nodularia spumigena TaxID=70799 RepID=UPI001F1F7FB3|nr:MBOAT family protein [Nodularia spumigena]
MLASLFFYAWWNPKYISLILVSVTINFFVSAGINKSLGSPQKKKLFLLLGIAFNLLLIGYYKYANFFVSSAANLFGTNLELPAIILPLGISFFTFQQIAYLVDSYKGDKHYNFVDYCLFITFFPQLIAGPIIHHSEVMPQFADKSIHRFNPENLAVGLTIFSLGLFKKVIFADGVAGYASPLFNSAAQGVLPGFLESWVGAIAYTLQLYFDFSGYSDMAIGIARMFGIILPANFFSPYKATGISDFWRRWHITLSNFLRDYLYIPLGGNRQGETRRNLNLMITMLLGGLWHGAGWQFILWGGLHGGYLVINHRWNVLQKRIGWKDNWLTLKVAWLVTFLCVVVGWVLFRADGIRPAFVILKSMTGLHGLASNTNLDLSKRAMLPLVILLMITFLAPNTQEWMRKYNPVLGYEQLSKFSSQNSFLNKFIWQPNKFYAIVTALITVFALLHLTRVSEFLYFQF